MKKLFTVFLTITLIFTFCACSVELEEQQNGHASDNVDLAEALAYLATLNIEYAEAPAGSTLLAPAKNESDGRYGYIDLYGNWVVEPGYYDTKEITEGLGIGLNGYSQYVYINRDGSTAFSSLAGYMIAESNHFSGDLLAVGLETGYDQKYVYVNKNFGVAINANNLPTVDWRYYPSTYYFAVATPFANGKAIVMRQKNANINDGLGEETAYIINTSGEIIGNLPQGIDPYSAGFDNNGNVIVYNSENRFGLCSSNGEMIIQCKYRNLKHCEGSLYLACDDNGFWGYVDQNDNKVIDFQYQKGLPFSEGHAAVFDGQHWGFIHEDGSIAIEFVFDDVSALNYPNVDSSLNGAAFKDGIAAVNIMGYWVLIDTEENPKALLTEDDCLGVEGCPYVGVKNGYVTFEKYVNGKVVYGVLNIEGKQILKPQFSYIGCFN